MSRLVSEPDFEGTQIVERLVGDREADDRIDQVGADVPREMDAEQHHRRMTDREEADIDADGRRSRQTGRAEHFAVGRWPYGDAVICRIAAIRPEGS